MIKYKNNINNLNKLRQQIIQFKNKEDQNIQPILKWRKKLIKKSKIVSKLINLEDCKDWALDKNKNLFHKSGQFFKVQGVRTTGAHFREVKSWTQPILNQKHGGILAFICRVTKKYGVQFLVEAKTEPGDNSDVKIAGSFQATQSNINKAHGGKRPKYYDIVVQLKGAKLIYCCSHNEEGARFWRKSNLNVIVQLKNPYDRRIEGKNFKWLSYSQLKKISLKNNIVSPFVKTILFMI